MTPFDWFLIGTVGVIVVIALVALRFPRGRADWPLDAKQTAWALASGLVALATFLMLYAVTRDVLWPSATMTVFIGTSLGLALLVAVSLLLPAGLRARP